MSETARRDTPKRGVVFIGRNDFQNKFLGRLIAERIGCSCLVRSIEDLSGPSVDAGVLALLDVEGIAAPDLNVHLQALATCASVRNIVLINADKGVSFEQIVACPGIKGIFCRETTEENFVKGILAIFKGECWLPRKMLFAHWEQTSVHKRLFPTETTLLTPKEIDTLKLTTRLAPIASAEGCARWNEINIRPDCGSPRTVQASDCSAPASRPSFSGELILVSFSHLSPPQKEW